MIELVNTQEELVGKLKQLKRKKLFTTPEPENYSWTNSHDQINFQGEKINVKFPSLSDYLGIRLLRPLREKLWNQGFIVYTPVNESARRESEIIEFLNKKGFPTFKSRQKLIQDDNYNCLVPGVVLTKFVDGVIHASDVMKRSIKESNKSNESLRIVEESGSLLQKAHNLGVFLGDPWYGNFSLVPNGESFELYMSDFEFRTNPGLDSDLRKAREVSQLVISGVRTGLDVEEVSHAMIKGYPSFKSYKQDLEKVIAYDEAHLSRGPVKMIRDSFYQKTVFGLDQNECLAVKKELYNQLR